MKILFLHGWKSVVGGRKPTFLQENGHEVINPALPDDDFDESVRIAENEYSKHQIDVIVGSSRGGAVAVNMQSENTPLVLLCPAWKAWGSTKTIKPNSVILHSRRDDVISFADSQELVANSRLSADTLIEVGADHRLADAEPLQAMLESCHRLTAQADAEPSILDHPAISGQYLFPQDRYLNDPFVVTIDDVELACYHKVIDPNAFTMIHFHGNGEAVADYIPFLSDLFSEMGVNSLFVEYREYGRSTGEAQLVAMLGDGEAAMKAAGVSPERAIVFGRSIGSLYAIELASRQASIAGLIIESGIADPSERFLQYADLDSAGINESDVQSEVKRCFDHKRKLSRYNNALLSLHAENDGLIDISHAMRNHKWAASQQKQLVRFASGNHNSIFSVNRTEYLQSVQSFLQAVQR